MTIRAVLFDCDGVLVDSEPITNRVLAENLTRHGLPVTPAECVAMFVGGTMRGVGETARARGARLPGTWLDGIYAEIFAALAEGTPAIPGGEAVFDALDGAGLGYAVGSNGPERKMEITLGHHPGLLTRLTGRVFSAQALGRPKPDPAVWLHAAAVLGVDPARCAVIEDSPSGCIAARRAGMACFGYAAAADPAALAAEGAVPFRAMEELPDLLGL